MSSSSQTRPLFYPVRQQNYICRVDAEEDVKDFRPLRPGLDSPEIVVLLLCPERAFHRSRPRSGKFLSDKVCHLFLLTERPASFYERCLYSVRLAVVPVFSSRVAGVSFDLFRFAPKQSLVHLQAGPRLAQKRIDKLEKAGIQCKLTGYNGGYIRFLGYTPETEALLEQERQEVIVAHKMWQARQSAIKQN